MLGYSAVDRYTGYDPSVNPGIANEFSTAAFRFGHSLLGDDVEFLDNNGVELAEEIPLSESFFNPGLLSEHSIDSIIKYLASDPASELDNKIVESVRNFLFGPPGAGGLDLASLNIQRGRDHGLADYNATRVAYGLRPVTSFRQITSNVEVQAELRALYGSVDNIDLWVGALAEDHVRGSSVGPTLRAVISDQFERLRDGDRFWYQNIFSGRMLRQIERTTLSDVISRNTDLSNLQDNVFVFKATISGTVLASTGGRTTLGSVLPGRTVELLDAESGEVVATATTNAFGRYRFDIADSVRTGQYQVRLVPQGNGRAYVTRAVSITTGDQLITNLNITVPTIRPRTSTNGYHGREGVDRNLTSNDTQPLSFPDTRPADPVSADRIRG